MLNTKSLPAYTNLSFPKKYEMNDKIILKTFSVTKKIKIKRYLLRYLWQVQKIKSKILYIFEKILVLSTICSKCINEDEKVFKEEESIEVLIILGLFKNI